MHNPTPSNPSFFIEAVSNRKTYHLVSLTKEDHFEWGDIIHEVTIELYCNCHYLFASPVLNLDCFVIGECLFYISNQAANIEYFPLSKLTIASTINIVTNTPYMVSTCAKIDKVIISS